MELYEKVFWKKIDLKSISKKSNLKKIKKGTKNFSKLKHIPLQRNVEHTLLNTNRKFIATFLHEN